MRGRPRAGVSFHAPATMGEPGAIAQLGERLDRTQEVAGSSPASSIRRRPCIRTALSPRASRIPARVAEDLQALVPLFGVIAADAGRSEASLERPGVPDSRLIADG